MARILIAGEDLEVVERIRAAVSAEGYETLVAMTGLEAYQTTLHEKPDLVFLGETMPVFNGFETCAMLREDPEIPSRLPVILVYAEQPNTRKMESVGFTDALPATHVVADIREMLAKYLPVQSLPIRDKN